MTTDKMTTDKTGRIVWHDLFTSDRRRSMAFYERIAGWRYEIEHATDFAWGGGEKDFVLALSDNEAGAGFAETPPALPNGWIAYVEVADVDASAAAAKRLGGTIVRDPFEVPGVGRNALLRDPHGALIGISLSRHDFPVPERQFGVEVYLSAAPAFPMEFYAQLFGWEAGPLSDGEQDGRCIAGPSGEKVALYLPDEPPSGTQAIWIPSLKVTEPQAALDDAKTLGATVLGQGKPSDGHAFLRAPDGAAICLPKA
ncbi:VOC family protein [Parasphingopyxis sp.]|uniref:VOC family protein n=1 Tax=Parasphingopyxis sp. TaxID=1920299 RepID=UPI00262056AF|nr:VOC family protein [Parasphingopyxis sp.]